MHIPENYLSPATCAVMGACMIPVWKKSIDTVKSSFPKEKIPLLGIGAAFSFVSMMFNVPLPGGTTGHAVGGTLLACLLGPEAACISISIALLLQCLLFGDGGVLSFGANCFNMAFVLPFIGYAIFQFFKKKFSAKKEPLYIAIASYIAINCAAFCAAVEFGIQPLLFTDASGNALYCPYGLSISIPAMMLGHLTLFGLAEVVFTVAIYQFLMKTAPDAFVLPTKSDRKKLHPAYYLLAALVILTPLGLLAQGTAWGEWGADELAKLTASGSSLTYVPTKILNGWSLSSLLPDYSLQGFPEWIAYIFSAFLGVAILIIIFKLISSMSTRKGTMRKG